MVSCKSYDKGYIMQLGRYNRVKSVNLSASVHMQIQLKEGLCLTICENRKSFNLPASLFSFTQSIFELPVNFQAIKELRDLALLNNNLRDHAKNSQTIRCPAHFSCYQTKKNNNEKYRNFFYWELTIKTIRPK